MKYLRTRWEKNWPEIHAALRGGFPKFVFQKKAEEPREVPVFWYHSVRESELRADLEFLDRNGYRTAAADEVIDPPGGGRQLLPRTVVLSFDDGARNLYTVTYPLLREFGATAVAFIAPAFHSVEDELPAEVRRPCSWRELGEMHASGVIDIQSHTLEHRYVPRWPEVLELSDVAARFQGRRREALPLEEDFRAARDLIRERLGKEVRHLAFPRFDGTAEAVAAGLRAGYRAFWWGAHPTPPSRVAGGVGQHMTRISGEFLQRLPGEGRAPLARILGRRYKRALMRLSGGSS